MGKKQYTEWYKSHFIEKKIECLHYSSSKWADFFTKDRDMFALQIHTDKSSEKLC
jgi:hypothetical protein